MTAIPYINKNDRRRPEKRQDPINENVRYPEVLVIGPNGEQLGKMSSRAANEVAASYDLDLFCVAPQAVPPVCKILNYGKYRYEKQKAEKEKKKNQHVVELKEVQLTPQIGQHDLETKAKNAREFLINGDRVQIIVKFKGRQMTHPEIGEETLKRFIDIVAGVSKVDKAPYWEGRNYRCIIAPNGKK